ncbi:MAG: GspH/FimT family pseudopilin [Gammaproteobacteria bacterium]|nr:GspH/FimT family pseudopilin [Gammaproteobacteria bacterium]
MNRRFATRNLLRISGFTLIELMITLAVTAILVTIGVPAMQQLIAGNRLTVETNDLITDLNLTRSEAIRSGQPATICKSSNGQNCESNTDWHQGWIVFRDIDGNHQLNNDETIVRHHGPLTQNTTINLKKSGVSTDHVLFEADGKPNGQNGSFYLCNSAGITRVAFTAPGRIRTEPSKDSTQCATAV